MRDFAFKARGSKIGFYARGGKWILDGCSWKRDIGFGDDIAERDLRDEWELVVLTVYKITSTVGGINRILPR